MSEWTNVPHPWYGPCDGFGPGKTCTECARMIEALLPGWWAVNPRADKYDLGPDRGPTVYCQSEGVALKVASLWRGTAEVTRLGDPTESAVPNPGTAP